MEQPIVTFLICIFQATVAEDNSKQENEKEDESPLEKCCGICKFDAFLDLLGANWVEAFMFLNNSVTFYKIHLPMWIFSFVSGCILFKALAFNQ